jgi:hypothetical protein
MRREVRKSEGGLVAPVLATWVIRLDLRGKQTEEEASYCFALPSP